MNFFLLQELINGFAGGRVGGEGDEFDVVEGFERDIPFFEDPL